MIRPKIVRIERVGNQEEFPPSRYKFYLTNSNELIYPSNFLVIHRVGMREHVILVNFTLLSVGDYQQLSLVIQMSLDNLKQLDFTISRKEKGNKNKTHLYCKLINLLRKSVKPNL